jgi:CRP-like cAMP-binding protein
METLSDQLAAHPFLAEFTPHEVQRLASWANRASFAAGTRIFEEGGHADGFWLIRDGHVRLDTTVPGRGVLTVETLGPGTVLGWSWLFEPYQWHFGAVAVEPTFALWLNGAGVRRLCEQEPDLGYKLLTRFLNVVVDRLQNTRIRLLDLYGSPT